MPALLVVRRGLSRYASWPVLFLVGALHLASCSVPAFLSSADSGYRSTTDIEREVFERINDYRRSQGLPPLAHSDRLAEVARRHSADMAAGHVPFGHTGFHERAAGLDGYRSISENVAFNNYPDTGSAQRAVEGWISSPEHHKSIVGAYEVTGIGVARGPRGRIFYTQLFAAI